MGDRPTHKLTLAKRNETQVKNNNIGVAWYDEYTGRISLALNPGVVLDFNTSQEFHITAFPIDYDNRSGFRRDTSPQVGSTTPFFQKQPAQQFPVPSDGNNDGGNEGDDDIPF